MTIWEITGHELAGLLASVRRGDVRKISVSVDGGVKIKVNELMWSPPMGELKS